MATSTLNDELVTVVIKKTIYTSAVITKSKLEKIAKLNNEDYTSELDNLQLEAEKNAIFDDFSGPKYMLIRGDVSDSVDDEIFDKQEEFGTEEEIFKSPSLDIHDRV